VAEGNEHANETRHAQGNQRAKEEWSHAGEVIFGLEGEHGQAKEDASGDEQGLKYDNVPVERDSNAKSESFHKSECRQENKVPWVCVALPEEKAKVDQGSKQRNVESPDVGLDPEYGRRRLRDDTANQSRSRNLTEQDGVDFTNERITDLWGALGNRDTILKVVGKVSLAGLVINSSAAAGGCAG